MKSYLPLFAIPVAAITSPAYGIQYMTVEQAQQALFPQASAFAENFVQLNDDQRDQIEALSDVRQRWKKQKVWKAMQADQQVGWFIVDKVIGKHEFITYAAAIDMNGDVIGIEIMDYRETYGGEVGQENWRKQFVGVDLKSPLKLNQDIQNISGATLSCRNVTNGVKRLLALHNTVLQADN
ncbi:FMN-binding protein [Thiomicrorhabdus sp. zzn3]|uniref:FMN-binding protein n=1 Tax=Thiomicrorhabdus sp. zzn3 TaxID=3039775 RepID=UPI002436E3DF|nr:FMN-binding protein [Thiomicrorhabdus sp. zzn3]MDG6777936.1 FMN-binding protein [Thiomicrorhabdus sp. zzn3]